MAIRHWKRIRERPDEPHLADDERDNPWTRVGFDASTRMAEVAPPAAPEVDPAEAAARAEQYQAWMARMRQKKEATRRQMQGVADDEPTSQAHWSTDALYAESKRVEEQELHTRPNPWRTRELLAVLDLREGATLDDVGTAYRQLAKKHHPDRFVEADDATREFHADRMRRINDAYRSLRTVLAAS